MKLCRGPRSSPCGTKHGIPTSLAAILLVALSLPAAESQQPTAAGPDYNYGRFSPSMAIIVVVLMAALFFMAFFSIYLRHCSGATNSASITARTGAEAGAATGRSRRGLDQSVINTFPTLEYSKVKNLKIGKGALECAVCLCEFEDDETLRLIPKCDHVFHPDCIDAWLGSHTTCPVCRANLVPQPGEPAPKLPPLDGEPESQAGETTDLEAGELEGREKEAPQVSLEPPPEKRLNRNRTRGSRSSRMRKLFPRSHSTGHSLIQPGEDTERFTLRLPAEVRKEIVNRQLNRATSLLVLPREGSCRQGYRTCEDSNRGRFSRRLDRFARSFRSDRWTFNRVPSFFTKSSSLRSPRVAAENGEGSSSTPVLSVDAGRPPV